MVDSSSFERVFGMGSALPWVRPSSYSMGKVIDALIVDPR